MKHIYRERKQSFPMAGVRLGLITSETPGDCGKRDFHFSFSGGLVGTLISSNQDLKLMTSFNLINSLQALSPNIDTPWVKVLMYKFGGTNHLVHNSMYVT